MKAQIVSFHCVLKNRLGQTLSSSFDQDVINQLEHESTSSGDPRLRGLVSGLQNVKAGERRSFSVPAHEAYGMYDPELVIQVPRAELRDADDLAVGSEVLGKASASSGIREFRATRIEKNIVWLDGNHPLAGQDLLFEIEVVSARDAFEEDFSEFSVSPGGTYVH